MRTKSNFYPQPGECFRKYLTRAILIFSVAVFSLPALGQTDAQENSDTTERSLKRGDGNKNRRIDKNERTGTAFRGPEKFIAEGTRDLIMEIKMAQLVQDRALSPHLKEAARDIVDSDREALRKLLAMSGNNAGGPDDRAIDSMISSFDRQHQLRATDSAAKRTSGNTVTDSLGSGSSGSGNVHGQDTGTLARTYSRKRNANYSSQGTYATSGPMQMDFFRDVQRRKGRDFEEQWLNSMMRFQSGRLAAYETAAGKTKDTELKAFVLGEIPHIRLSHSNLARIQKNGKYSPAAPLSDDRDGPSRKNTP